MVESFHVSTKWNLCEQHQQKLYKIQTQIIIKFKIFLLLGAYDKNVIMNDLILYHAYNIILITWIK